MFRLQMQRRWLVVLAVVVAAAYSMPVDSESHKEIEELFGDEEEIGVIAVLYDDYGILGEYQTSNYKDDFEMKKIMVNC